MRRYRRFWHRQLLFIFLCCGWPVLSWAQVGNAARGQSLYTATCAVCHGSDPRNNSTRNVANNPDALFVAMQVQPTMAFLRSALSSQDVLDITTYVGSVIGTSGSFVHESGWYWNPQESGRGYFFEKRGNNVFMAGFIYAADGRASWFTAQGGMNGNVFNSVMLTFANGQTLTGPYRAPIAGPALGNISWTFTSANTVRLTQAGSSTDLVRFPFATGSVQAAAQAGSAESGWWWNASESGRGYALEFQGNQFFLIGFLYDDAGNPLWLLSNGVMQTPTLYNNNWLQFANGQALGQPYRAPQLLNGNVGSLQIRFGADRRTAVLVLPDGRELNIVRFDF